MTPPLITPPPETMEILQALRQHNHTAYLCGGCVRDALLGATPKDYDITTSATPDAIEKIFPKTLPIGKAFGVTLVVDPSGSQHEIATFRHESAYSDGRRPDHIYFSTPQEDAARRDFTINALFYNPFTNSIIDYVDGQKDIQTHTLRTVGNPHERFREDHLRLLRAIRFAARTGFTIDLATWQAVQDLAPLVATVSPERIAAETETMLTDGHSRHAFEMLKTSTLLPHILPELDALANVPQPPDFHPEGDVWTHTLLLLDLNDQTVRNEIAPLDHSSIADIDPKRGMETGDFTPEQYVEAVRDCRAAMTRADQVTLAWSGLLHDIGKPDTITHEDRIRFNNHDLLGAEMAVAVLERLKRPKRTVEGAYDLIRRHIHFSTLRKMRKSKLRRWLQNESFPLHLELHRLDCVSSHHMLGNWFFGVEAWREERAKEPEPEPLLRGGDLLELGLPPGPEIGKLLRLVEDARLEGEVTTRDDALALVRRRLDASAEYEKPK